MARKPRVHLPGGVSHVTVRGNGGQPIGFAEPDHRPCETLLEHGNLVGLGHPVHRQVAPLSADAQGIHTYLPADAAFRTQVWGIEGALGPNNQIPKA